MRTVSGEIVLPRDVARGPAHTVLIEVRDVSVADAPSTVVAASRLRQVAVGPGDRLPFSLEVPEHTAGRRLEIRVHVDVEGTGQVSSGDFLTTESVGVPATGSARSLSVPVKKV